MEIAFVMSKQMPQKVWQIKLNPDFKDIQKLNDYCEAMGSEKYMVVYLSKDEYCNLAQFIKAEF